MPKKLLFGLVFVGVFALLSNVTQATTVERLTLQDLTVRSQSIVQGIVRGSRSYWSPNGKLILTSTTIEVTESIKGQGGQAPRTVDITTVGGQIGDTVLRVGGMPSFAPGESTIVFVERSNGYTTVLGLGQGKFTVANGEVANSVSELTFADGAPARISRMSEQVFKSQIRLMLERAR
jgi:hypothetical protein